MAVEGRRAGIEPIEVDRRARDLKNFLKGNSRVPSGPATALDGRAGCEDHFNGAFLSVDRTDRKLSRLHR